MAAAVHGYPRSSIGLNDYLPKTEGDADTKHTHLVVSPYTTLPHLLDLTTVDISCQLLARALTIMDAVREDYATAPYLESFNWPHVIDRLRALAKLEGYRWTERSFYVVVFRSRLIAGVDRTNLGALDELAHREATSSGGLLKYWYGRPDENRRNLATCTCLRTGK